MEIKLYLLSLKLEKMLGSEAKSLQYLQEMFTPKYITAWWDGRRKRLKMAKDTQIAMMLEARIPYRIIQKSTGASPNRVAEISKMERPPIKSFPGMEDLEREYLKYERKMQGLGFKDGIQ